MAKGKTSIQGLYFEFRTSLKCDVLRVWVRPPNGKQVGISAKLCTTLREINQYLRSNGLREAETLNDNQFQVLWHRLQQELKSEHGLRTYKIQEMLSLKTKEFDFESSIEEFKKYKSNTSVSHAYYSTMKRFWLPFFIRLGCVHPCEFKNFLTQAETHIRTAETGRGERYSHHSYNVFCKVLNQYMVFLTKYKYVGPNDSFKLWITTTLEEKKRGQLKRKRSTDTFSLEEVIEIKQKIDKTYETRPEEKAIAYGFYLGICTGLRQGNILGLKAENLYPDEAIPYFHVTDNIVSGWSRGIKGFVIFENATKTTSEEDGEVYLPFLQPSREIVCEVARYLKQCYRPHERILPLKPSQVYRRWQKIAEECGFKFLSPHNWKHSYATIGAERLDKWYKGDPRLLQLCCLHTSFKMTEKYIKKKYAKSLAAWSST